MKSNGDDRPDSFESMTLDRALAEAARCLLCHDAPCSGGCPSDTDPASFIRKLRFRNLKGAIAVIKNRNILGGVCGILCPTCRLCKGKCTTSKLDRPIEISRLQRFLVEYGWKIGFNPIEQKPGNGIRAAVVGAGPAGLTCAAELAKEGFEVEIFEKMAEPGGMLRYGVPEFRLSRDYVRREIRDITDLGVKISCNSPIAGADGIKALFERGFKAVFVGTGTWQSIRTGMGGGLENLVDGLEFLKGCAKRSAAENETYFKGRTVAVIGGGDTAIDAAVSAAHYGAAASHIIYRRSFAQMPGSRDEKISAIDAGVHFMILSSPVDYVSEGGRVTGVKVVLNRLGEPDASGRAKPLPVPGSEHVIAADIVVEALGLEPAGENEALFSGLKRDPRGFLVTSEKAGETSSAGVYAGGDIARGPSIVAEAVSDGKLAARAIIDRFAGNCGSTGKGQDGCGCAQGCGSPSGGRKE